MASPWGPVTCGLQVISHLLLIALSWCLSMILVQTIFFSSFFFKPFIGQEARPLSSMAVTFLTSQHGLLLSPHGQQEHPGAQVPLSCGHLRRNLGMLWPLVEVRRLWWAPLSAADFQREAEAGRGDQEGNGILEKWACTREITRVAQNKGKMAAWESVLGETETTWVSVWPGKDLYLPCKSVPVVVSFKHSNSF